MTQLFAKGYKLLLTDFDGTLAQSNGLVSPSVKNAIELFKKDGGAFAVVSGRSLLSLRRMMKASDILGYAVGSHGAVISDERGKLLASFGIDYKRAAQTAKLLEQAGLFCIAFIGDRLICSSDSLERRQYEATSGCEVEICSGLSGYIEKTAFEVHKLLVIDDARSISDFCRDNINKLPCGLDISGTRHDYLEIVDQRGTKGEAVKFLLSLLGIKKEESIAVGDTEIDISMFKTAGLGVAVHNATDKCRQAADVICAYSNDEDALERIITSKEWSL